MRYAASRFCYPTLDNIRATPVSRDMSVDEARLERGVVVDEY
jgi:hypothetical protein